jgi:hypothetical protein
VERSLFRSVPSDVSPGKTTQTQSDPASQAVPFTQEMGRILPTIHRAASCRKVRGSKAWKRLEQKGLADVPTAGCNLMPPPNTTLCHHPPRSEYAQMPPLNSALRRRRLPRYPTSLKYIRHFNKVSKPIRWTYANPTRRIAHLDDHRPTAATGSPAPRCLVRVGDCYTGVPVLVPQSPD